MANWTLVTGASSGIGEAFAEIAARENRNVVIAARRTDRLEALAERLKSLGAPDVRIVTADLSVPEDCERVWAEATRDATLDVVVNNAGLGSYDRFDVGDWSREKHSIDVNVTALTYFMKMAVQHMTAAGQGRIINVGSLAGFMPGPGMAVYHATKAYVLSLTEAVAEELSGTGVTVTVLCPGATKSEFAEVASMQDANLIKRAPKIPTSAEVAEAGWLAARSGKRVIIPGLVNKIMGFSPRLLPRIALLKATKLVMGRS